jgi:uncharacterized membrane protein YcjF (UPF0283 family)
MDTDKQFPPLLAAAAAAAAAIIIIIIIVIVVAIKYFVRIFQLDKKHFKRQLTSSDVLLSTKTLTFLYCWFPY